MYDPGGVVPVTSTGKFETINKQFQSKGAGSVENYGKQLKILSWNIDGLRSMVKAHEEKFLGVLAKVDADVVCFQEHKLQSDNISKFVNYFNKLGYESWWSVSRLKKGYAGTAVLVKSVLTDSKRNEQHSFTVVNVVTDKDEEGRLTVLELRDMFIVNCYVPNSGNELQNLGYRTKTWDPFLFGYLGELSRQKELVVSGDFNVAHLDADMYEKSGTVAGTTNEERFSFNWFLEHSKLVDAFREYNPVRKGAYTCWRRGNKNYEHNRGYRFDYMLCSSDLLKEASPLRVISVNNYHGVGCDEISDHCPMVMRIQTDEKEISLIPRVLKSSSKSKRVRMESDIAVMQSCGGGCACAITSTEDYFKDTMYPQCQVIDESNNFVEQSRHRALLLAMNMDIPRTLRKSALNREAKMKISGIVMMCPRTTYDTGASSGSYIGRGALALFPESVLVYEPCSHRAVLGDGKTQIHIKQTVTIEVIPIDDYDKDWEPITVEMFVVETMNNQMIIGLPDLLGSFFDYFACIMNNAASKRPRKLLGGHSIIDEVDAICNELEDELYRKTPRIKRMQALAKRATSKLMSYTRLKEMVQKDPDKIRHVHRDTANEEADANSIVECSEDLKVVADSDQTSSADETVYLLSARHNAVVFEDDRIEDIVAAIQVCTEQDVSNIVPGAVLKPWSAIDEPCEEELSTPDPVAFGEDIAYFMETSVEDARKEYLETFEKQIKPEMVAAVPRILEIMKSSRACEVFSPSKWNGLRMEPVVLETSQQLPSRLAPKARPIRDNLYEHAKAEFDRLSSYFYEESKSPIASPLVIAPKATNPFIRFCGDYREVNKYIKIPQQPIPIVQHELMKAAKFKVYVDLDMANSFHQIPLSKEFSEILSVKTPWGLFKPKFLPEGVGPASGLLQHIVREIFQDFSDWTIVIFDNFLILADDYEDACQKFEKILAKCEEYGIVLKLKKSWIGADTVTFFGYEVSNGTWKLSDTRKKAISELEFPTNKKQMQSFLGAALFFHHHIPNYSNWSNRLYEMTHENFSWNPATWKVNYREYFDQFKTVLTDAATLYFPDYSLKWVIRCDASDAAVGGILFQIYVSADGTETHQPIAFCSKRLSGAAEKWDAYKKEAFAIYYSVSSFDYYLKGKEFLVESDHRNLQWIESSQSPIIVRWRTLLQSYDFLVRHIPGKENTVADWISRMYVVQGAAEDSIAQDTHPKTLSVDEALKSVHGGYRFHFGAYETWRRFKNAFPNENISVEMVRQFVKECPVCQKMRDVGIRGLESVTKTLKPAEYRARIGIDHMAITPADKHGNKVAIVIVEHYSHFVSIYPCKSYDEDTVLAALIRHYSTFGLFDEIASDPGSAFMGKAVSRINEIFGVRHKVSLVGRHESNGVEGSIKQILRHLRTLVFEKGFKDRWSDDTVLPLITFTLNDRTTPETGGFTPFQLKYGSKDAQYFKLPEEISAGAKATAIIKQLDKDLTLLRFKSKELQNDLAHKRRQHDKPHTTYAVGDLILWNPDEHPGDLRPVKLSPSWYGPYRVIWHKGNDIHCEHVVMKELYTFHVDRCRPFFGDFKDALEVGKYDHDQFIVKSINYFMGNPHLRTSMLFNVTFQVGEFEETAQVKYSPDLANTQQFVDYVNVTPYLLPLKFNAKEATTQYAQMTKTPITDINIHDELYVDMRYFDGTKNEWFDNLGLPHPTIGYYMKVQCTRWTSSKHIAIECYCAVFQQTYVLNHYDMETVVLREVDWNDEAMILVTEDMRKVYPKLFQ